MSDLFVIDSNMDLNYDSFLKLLELEKFLSMKAFASIDISIESSWFNSVLCPFMTAILRKNIEKNGLNIRIGISKPSVNDIFHRNGFWGEVYDVNDTIVPLQKFNRNENENFLAYISRHLQSGSNKFPFSKIFSDFIKENLAELFSNCEIHSQTDRIYVGGQYFPNKHQFSFCLTDVGIGIAKHISEKISLTNMEAIQWAFQKNNTTKEDGPGGLGLKRLKKGVLENKGDLFVIANNILFDVLKNKIYENSVDFHGTSVILSLNEGIKL